MPVPAVLVPLVLAVVAAPSLLLGPVEAPAPPASAGRTPVLGTPVPAAPARDCPDPARLLDLTDWKITLPVAKSDNAKSPLEVTQPRLADYTRSPYFVPAPDCAGVIFRAPVNGVTTSGSKNPRSELREMTGGGREPAAWSSTAGEHRMTVREAFTHLPEGKPELVGAQIHDADDDVTVFRLEGRKLWITEGDDPHHTLVTDDYRLGTPFQAGFDVSGGEVRVSYNGAVRATLPARFRGAYFKVGAYTQANCSNVEDCDDDNYGETTVYAITVSHQVTTAQLVWDAVVRWAPAALAVLVVLAVVLVLVRRRSRRSRTEAG